MNPYDEAAISGWLTEQDEIELLAEDLGLLDETYPDPEAQTTQADTAVRHQNT